MPEKSCDNSLAQEAMLLATLAALWRLRATELPDVAVVLYLRNFTRLAETSLAQNTLSHIEIA